VFQSPSRKSSHVPRPVLVLDISYECIIHMHDQSKTQIRYIPGYKYMTSATTYKNGLPVTSFANCLKVEKLPRSDVVVASRSTDS